MAHVQKVGIGGRERLVQMPGGLGRDAVSHADRAPYRVVVETAKPTGGRANIRTNGDGIQEIELCEVQTGLVLVGFYNPDKVVDHFTHADRGQPGISRKDQRPDLACGGLSLQVGEDGVGVEDSQRPVARRASSRRAAFRARSVDGPRPRYLPSSASTGFSTAGLMTTRSPRSTTITR